MVKVHPIQGTEADDLAKIWPDLTAAGRAHYLGIYRSMRQSGESRRDAREHLALVLLVDYNRFVATD